MPSPDAHSLSLEQQRFTRHSIYQIELYDVLTGIYIVVYMGTMYLYTQRKVAANEQRRMVISITTVLFLLQIAQAVLNWYRQKWIIIIIGEPPSDVIEPSPSVDPVPRAVIHLWGDIIYFLSFILADWLMVWRCYHVWGRSLLIIAIPCFLLVVETAIYLSMIILISTVIPDVTPSKAFTLNCLQVALYVIPIVISLAVTYLICHKIFTASRELKNNRFKSIMDMLIQSSALYTAMILVTLTVSGLPVPARMRNDDQFFADAYLANILGPISGIIPTLMVARVTILSYKRDQTQPGHSNEGLSRLNFAGQTTTVSKSRQNGSIHIPADTNEV